ncbi:peptidase inhibitor family I36 protein [Pilimelia terevasa]|nr:peptidase inhibitor family I36 protein [Pilimelia terevasa]
MRTNVKAAMAALVTILAGTALQATTTGAAQADGKEWRDCPDSYVCLWDDGNYAGRYRFQPEHDAFVSWIGSAMNDRTTSIWNRTGSRVCFYDHVNYQGELLCLDGGGANPNVGAELNDRISSFQRMF